MYSIVGEWAHPKSVSAGLAIFFALLWYVIDFKWSNSKIGAFIGYEWADSRGNSLSGICAGARERAARNASGGVGTGRTETTLNILELFLWFTPSSTFV